MTEFRQNTAPRDSKGRLTSSPGKPLPNALSIYLPLVCFYNLSRFNDEKKISLFVTWFSFSFTMAMI